MLSRRFMVLHFGSLLAEFTVRPMRIFEHGEWKPLEPEAHNVCKYVQNSTLFRDEV